MSFLNSLENEETKNSPTSSSFKFRPLPPTFGTTLGNFLRQILLNSLSGVGIWGVEIFGKKRDEKKVLVDFSLETAFDARWEGIDVPVPRFLIAKLKEIVFIEKKVKKGIFILELDIENNTKKERVIKAGDLEKTKEFGVEIKNPELVLATLSPGGKLVLRLHCQRNFGYHSVEQQKKSENVQEYLSQTENQTRNIIFLDTDYSPLRVGQVSFEAKSVVVDLDQKEENLILTINTNGAVEPRKALLEALEIAENSLEKVNNSIVKS